LFSKQTQKPNVKHFYLVFYLIKDAGSNLQRFLKASDTPISISDLRNPLKRYFFTPELSSDQIEILAFFSLVNKHILFITTSFRVIYYYKFSRFFLTFRLYNYSVGTVWRRTISLRFLRSLNFSACDASKTKTYLIGQTIRFTQ